MSNETNGHKRILNNVHDLPLHHVWNDGKFSNDLLQFDKLAIILDEATNINLIDGLIFQVKTITKSGKERCHY